MKPRYVKFDAAFEKRFKKYTAQMSEAERRRLKKRLEIFKEDVFDKRLKTHKLKGELAEYYAFSISYSDRIVFKILDNEGVYLMEIGGHDVCY
ncbi:MAG: type II toxin-antitoxin system mRNA interferase toxin, RelE/StbE family [Deltaproteobacteria bacterium]|nr:type II toxin-antitoxin system mRNA interferase toxin, RelE/StbE family [Deltaproteobacteria bacterium]